MAHALPMRIPGWKILALLVLLTVAAGLVPHDHADASHTPGDDCPVCVSHQGVALVPLLLDPTGPVESWSGTVVATRLLGPRSSAHASDPSRAPPVQL